MLTVGHTPLINALLVNNLGVVRKQLTLYRDANRLSDDAPLHLCLNRLDSDAWKISSSLLLTLHRYKSYKSELRGLTNLAWLQLRDIGPN